MNEEELLQSATRDKEPLVALEDRKMIAFDRVSVNDGPYYQPKSITSKLDIVFRGVPQTDVVEFCISEGWIQKYMKNWKGRPVTRGDNYVLGPKLKGTVEVYWKV